MYGQFTKRLVNDIRLGMCFLRVLCAFCDVSFVLCPCCARGALMGSARGVVFVVVCACCDRVDVYLVIVF